jgi:serine palmitoyltransferase
MEHTLGSVGGFCASSSMFCSHQTLYCTGYCYSASLPAYATCAAIAALDTLEAEPQRLTRLREASAALCSAVRAALGAQPHLEISCDPNSPVAHIRISPIAAAALSHKAAEQLLRDAAAASAASPAPADGLKATLMVHSGLAHIQPPRPPSLRLVAHADVRASELAAAAVRLAECLSIEISHHSATLAFVAVDDPLSPEKIAAKTAALEAFHPPSPTLATVDGAEDRPRTLFPEESDEAGEAPDFSDMASMAGTAMQPQGERGGAAAAPPTISAAPAVTTPLVHLFDCCRVVIRNYVLRQMEWHAFSLAPQLARLRAARPSGPLHTLYSVGHFLGSEAFYFSVIPVLAWSTANEPSNHLSMFVAYFSLNVYVGNWLKNLFALARRSSDGHLDTSDFGWPSMYAVNAVGLPFFALRYWFGAFGQGTLYSAENQIFTGVSCAEIAVYTASRRSQAEDSGHVSPHTGTQWASSGSCSSAAPGSTLASPPRRTSRAACWWEECSCASGCLFARTSTRCSWATPSSSACRAASLSPSSRAASCCCTPSRRATAARGPHSSTRPRRSPLATHSSLARTSAPSLTGASKPCHRSPRCRPPRSARRGSCCTPSLTF